eukprot:9035034-Heterocapsa_arctica.AAC.1
MSRTKTLCFLLNAVVLPLFKLTMDVATRRLKHNFVAAVADVGHGEEGLRNGGHFAPSEWTVCPRSC